ncbi:MAG: hypothetical protein JWO01_1204 [Microbacteriaceae bacterium]|nr:hypothetical protein [Microbacteriaceae bacterium]
MDQRTRRAKRGTAVGLVAILFVIAALFAAIDMATIHRDPSRSTWSHTTTPSHPPQSKTTPKPTPKPAPTSTPPRDPSQ